MLDYETFGHSGSSEIGPRFARRHQDQTTEPGLSPRDLPYAKRRQAELGEVRNDEELGSRQAAFEKLPERLQRHSSSIAAVMAPYNTIITNSMPERSPLPSERRLPRLS